MCGCDDDCCGCISYRTRKNIKHGCICFGFVAAVVVIAVLLAAYAFLRHVTITVEDASLTRFALLTTQGRALAYNLSLNLNVRNPNWAMSIKNTEPFEAAYKFDGQQFDRLQVSDKGEKHPPRKTMVYRLDSRSDHADVPLGDAGEAEYKKENETGVFEVEVALTREVRYTARYTKCKIAATRKLKLKLAKPETTAVVFEKVKCKLEKAEKNC